MKDITNLKDLEEREHALGGSHWIAKFQNGYGASVIRTPFSYGGVIEDCMNWRYWTVRVVYLIIQI